MVKKLILACLIGVIGLIVFSNPAWSQSLSHSPLWLAQTERIPQTVPSEHPSVKAPDETTPLSTDEQTPSKQKVEVERSTKTQNVERSNPFNPYNMKALKRFDAGDHRSH